MANQPTENAFDAALKLHQAGRLSEAARIYRRILDAQPRSAEALHHLGVIEAQAGRHESAVHLIRQAISLKPDYAEAHNNLGHVLINGPHPEQAIGPYRQAVALRPDYFEAYNGLANALRKLGRPNEAIAAYRQAIALRPNSAEAHDNLGTALREIRQFDAAVAAYRQAIVLRPQFAGAFNNLGGALKATGQIDQAIAAYRQAIALAPNNPQFHSNLVYAMCFQPGASAQAIRAEAVRWNDRHGRPLASEIRPCQNDRDPDRPLRIGYISPNFRQHTNGFSMLPLLKNHDRSRFQIFCYSDVKHPDHITQKCRDASDQWRSIVGVNDQAVAQVVRQDRIDIFVDLVSHMANNRLLVFARKPAPVQTTYLCNQATTGLSTMDYRLSDPHIDPPGCHDADYTEQTVRLPDCYLCFEPLPDSPPVNDLPALKAGHITFGSLNNFNKVMPPVLDLWGRVLLAVPESRLILRCPDGQTQRRVIDLIARNGINPARIQIFSDWPAGAEYLRLHHTIDIYLDPFPHAGHTTSMDALWMGVPLVTLAGETAGGRGGVFILENLGFGDLIAQNEREYAEKATTLARDLPGLANLRSSLRPRLAASPLMDAPRFARNVEQAYRQMWKRYCEGR